jgi:hypothetical protein
MKKNITLCQKCGQYQMQDLNDIYVSQNQICEMLKIHHRNFTKFKEEYKFPRKNNENQYNLIEMIYFFSRQNWVR